MNVTVAMLCLVLTDFEDKFDGAGVTDYGEGVND